VVGRLRRLVERPDLAGQVQPLSLTAAVHDVLRLLEPELARRGIAPEVVAEPNLPSVQAEPVALQQIIHNLLMNALQAMDATAPGERRLTLRLARQGSTQVTLCVRDHGPGVPPEVRGHLFEPFFTTRKGGLGLGLTLCESLAQAMGASLALAPHDSAAPGAEFILTLPVAQATATP
jgi:C4-dicarboxylate-specific signal transduction histidine kinase